MRLWQEINLKVGNVVSLSVNAVHYVCNVRRLTVGDELIIFNGEGGEYLAQILESRAKQCVVKIMRYYAIERESLCNIELVQGIPHSDKMDWIVQKAVELGVKKITPVITSRTQSTKFNSSQLYLKQQHWQKIAISASEQCGRTYVPKIALPVTLTQWSNTFTGQSVVLLPNINTRITDIAWHTNHVSLVIGPEGGLSQEEINLLNSNNCVFVCLGPRILRTETAALAAISILDQVVSNFFLV